MMPQLAILPGVVSLEPVDFRPRQFYIGTSSESLQTHSEISKKIRLARNQTSVLPVYWYNHLGNITVNQKGVKKWCPFVA